MRPETQIGAQGPSGIRVQRHLAILSALARAHDELALALRELQVVQSQLGQFPYAQPRVGQDLDDGDMLKVTSMDGKIEVMYKLALDLTGIDASAIQQIVIYPNPSEGALNVSGLKPGNRIRVFNTMGVIVRDLKAQNILENFDLNDQPSGMYMIVISDENKLLGRFKAVID